MHKLKSLMAKHRRCEAEFIRNIRISMYPIKELPPTEKEMSLFKNIVAGIFVGAFILIAGCTTAQAEEYTDTQIVNAIRKAEGTWTYGIKSIKCETEKECRQICFNTVKNNRRRYSNFIKTNVSNKDFIAYLAGVYCPIGAKNDQNGLNRNWEKNVRYFLARSK